MTRTRRPSKPSASTVAVAYLRVSTEDQDLGPDAQREAIRRWAAVHGMTVAGWYEDRVSGAAQLDKRPGLALALAAVADTGAAVLVVAKRDRLARDPVVAAMVEGAAARTGARVVSAAGEGTEGDDPTSLLMRRIVDAFAEYERMMIRARTSAALAVKASRGERTGGIPYGHRLAGDGIHLEVEPREAAVIAAARKLRASGASLRAIGEALAADGMLPRSGGRWHAETVKALLRVAA